MNTIWVLAFCHRSLCEEHWIWEASFRFTFRMKCRIVVFPLYMIQSILKVLRQRHFENLCWNISVNYKKSIFLFHKKTPLQEQNSCRGVVFLTKLAAYRKGLFILWSVPFPIANFFKILTILSDILLMLNKLVVHLLDEVGTTVC